MKTYDTLLWQTLICCLQLSSIVLVVLRRVECVCCSSDTKFQVLEPACADGPSKASPAKCNLEKQIQVQERRLSERALEELTGLHCSNKYLSWAE